MKNLSDRQACQFPCLYEYPGEHGAIEAASVGVSQGWMVCGQEMKAIREKIESTVGKAVFGFACDDAGKEEVGEIAIEGDLAQTDDDAGARQCLNLAGEVA